MASWPPPELVEVREIPGRGRGLVALQAIAAGAPVLCEPALAAASLKGCESQQDPWLVAARLAALLLASEDVHNLTRNLMPQCADGLKFDNDTTAAVVEIQKVAPGRLSVDETELLRLLHVVRRNALEILGHQAICVRASMCNHSCMPNATHQGFRRAADGALCVVVRAVRDVAIGDEVCISYIEDLACSAAERAEALASHGITPDERACDAALEAWARDAPPPSDTHRQTISSELASRATAADRAWTDALKGQSLMTASATADAKQALLQAAAHYAQLLQRASGILGEGHAIVLLARLRLAQLMMSSGAQRSQANALPLWKAVLEATRPCVPDAWPALLEPLRGAAAAASAAGDSTQSEHYAAEAERVLTVLNPRCRDVSA